jgi:signal transduction histidine kinase
VNERLVEYARVHFTPGSWEPVACGALLRTVEDLLAPEIAHADARITVEPLPTLLGDRGQLLVLFRHLLANALRHAGDTPPRVHVKAEREAGAWCFTVTDNGPGLPADELARLRGDGSATLEVAAPGLGLALCRAVVERHGGRLWAVSDPRRGTAVHFTLMAGASS